MKEKIKINEQERMLNVIEILKEIAHYYKFNKKMTKEEFTSICGKHNI